LRERVGGSAVEDRDVGGAGMLRTLTLLMLFRA
jgi:hypothetical protein